MEMSSESPPDVLGESSSSQSESEEVVQSKNNEPENSANENNPKRTSRSASRSQSSVSGLASDYDHSPISGMREESDQEVKRESDYSERSSDGYDNDNESQIRGPGKFRCAAHSSSPGPPQQILWSSPPSPFLEAVYNPSCIATEMDDVETAHRPRSRKRQLDFRRRLEIFNRRKATGFSDPKDKARVLMRGNRDDRLEKSKQFSKRIGEEFSTANAFDTDELLLTNSIALKLLTPITSSEFYDPELELRGSKSQIRRSRPFKIARPGTFERKAHVIRSKILTKQLEEEGEQNRLDEEEEDVEFGFFERENAPKRLLGDENPTVEKDGSVKAPLTDGGKTSERLSFLDRKSHAQPTVEWWDRDLLKESSYDLGEPNFVKEMITHYVQTPTAVKPALNPRQPESVPLFLTSREQKKARRMKRRAKLEVQAERVRLGLEEPPDPKVSLANLMRVLSTSAVPDPSAVEREVRAKIEKRRLAHLLHNEVRKLTPQERRLKKRKKLQENLLSGVEVAIFRLNSTELLDGKARFKMDVTATQHNLSGLIVTGQSVAAVVVEGGSKGLRKFKRLMANRIEWKENALDGDGLKNGNGDEEAVEAVDGGDRMIRSGSVCVWEGMVQKRQFQGFTTHVSRSESHAEQIFAERKLAHYWHIVKATKSENDALAGNGT